MRPRHPYTAGLLALHARPVREHTGGSSPIPGRPLSLLEQPTGCAFAARCAFVVEGFCDAEVPELVDAAGHAVRCLRSAELADDLARLVAPEGATP